MLKTIGPSEMTAIRRIPETCWTPVAVNLQKSNQCGVNGRAQGAGGKGGYARLDKEVGDGHDDGHAERSEQLGVDDGPPRRPGHVRRELLGRVAELLALVTGDLGPRQSAVADPRVGVVPRVSARHPPEELAVVDHEVRERELVGVEQEGREAEREGRDPEVDEPVDPEG